MDQGSPFPWQSRPLVGSVFTSAESLRVAAACVLRPSDVIVCTFMKTGTTWLQQVCEQLRTGGNMDFSEITEVQPWLEQAWDCGQDLDADQRAAPRLFKSHNHLTAINPGAKYITIVRDPEKTLLSVYSFLKAKGRPGVVETDNVNEYASTGHFADNNFYDGNMFQFYSELWLAKDLPNVLVLCYEAMMANPRSHIQRIATFMGLDCDERLLDTVEEMSSMEYMKEHDDQFNDNFLARKQAELGRAKFSTSVTTKVGLSANQILSEESKQWLRQMWHDQVEAATGLQSYEEMAAKLQMS